jgi:hypothetical protein
MNRRSLRLELVAGLGMALAMAALPAAGATTGNIATETTLNVGTSDHGGRTLATVAASVTGTDGMPATGAVSIEDGSRELAEVALNGAGQASATIGLPGGAHALRAVYTGDATHQASSSAVSETQGTASSAPNFQLTLTPIAPATFPMMLTPGQAGTLEVTVTPENNAALTAPMFVTLSCSGLPNQASCTFTPESVEILPTTPASCSAGSPPANCPPVSSMLLQTVAQTPLGSKAEPLARPGAHRSPIAWALLLPGVLGLGGLAFGARRRRWLSRLALVALLGVVTTLGATGCNPQYYYYHHGPGSDPPTPAGTYTVTITGQSSNGVTAITNPTTMVLTVQ